MQRKTKSSGTAASTRLEPLGHLDGFAVIDGRNVKVMLPDCYVENIRNGGSPYVSSKPQLVEHRRAETHAISVAIEQEKNDIANRRVNRLSK